MDYHKHYDRLISRAKTRKPLEGYKERHHIKPKCMGGNDDVDNIVELTASEHYIAHQLLLKMYPNNHKLAYACHMMSSSLNGRNNKSYEWVRKRMAIANSIVLKGKKRPPRSKEWSNNISKAKKGKPQSEEANKKRSEALKGRVKSDEFKAKMSIVAKNRTKEHQEKLNISHTGAKRSEEARAKMRAVSLRQELIQCPHCGKIGKPRGMKCWHFDRCKENPNGL
ncbi:homing endonuclease [Providencia phage PSTRCR_121]|nr:homing endonuclease [Providencia phage PSTRCR_121]UGO50181.1 putative homing endonuclease [Morganella phage vB_MmoM_Rgz1]